MANVFSKKMVKTRVPDDLRSAERSQKRKKFFKRFWQIFWILLVVGVGVSTYFLGRSTLDMVMEKAVYTNRFFTLRDVDIETHGGISGDWVLSFLNLHPNEDNLMLLSVGEMQEKLRRLSVIADATVFRTIPDTLHIEVHARVPVARYYVRIANPLTLNDSQYATWYMDAKGYVMAPDELFYEIYGMDDLDIPIILAMRSADILIPSHCCNSPEVIAALQLIRLYAKSSLAVADKLNYVDVGDAGFLIVTTSNNVEAVLDCEDIQQGLARWASIQAYALANENQIKTINVSVTNTVPVVWMPTVPERNRFSRTSQRSG